MTTQDHQDSHIAWLDDVEYRGAYGAESAKLEFAAALTAAREANNATQALLAERCGVSQAYVAKLESGNANPTIGQVGRLFAGVWSRPVVGFAPLVPSMSFESSMLTSMSEEPQIFVEGDITSSSGMTTREAV